MKLDWLVFVAPQGYLICIDFHLIPVVFIDSDWYWFPCVHDVHCFCLFEFVDVHGIRLASINGYVCY